jgi:multidrug efflux pump
MARIRAYMDALPELIDIDDTRALPSIEWRMQVDRAQAALYGADVVVRRRGAAAGHQRREDRRVPTQTAPTTPSTYGPASPPGAGYRAMDGLRSQHPAGAGAAEQFREIEPAPGVDTFERIDGMAVERCAPRWSRAYSPTPWCGQIEQWLATQDFDSRVDIQFRGANEEQADSLAFVQVAFLLSLLLMFVLLVTQFNSFYQSALILLAVIMSTAGVLLGLLVTGDPFSAILTGVGVVALAGIVVNNNIVLIDTFNYVRKPTTRD